MKKRLLCLGLFAAVAQLFGSGCHPVARWRANHPCGTYHHHPLLHPIQTRRAIFAMNGGGYPPAGADVSAHSVGPAVSGAPVVMTPPCHGCGDSHGVPVAGPYPIPTDVVPTGVPPGVPSIGQPMPITPGPTVIPSYELPAPMPVPKGNGN